MVVVYLFDKGEWDEESVKKLSEVDCIRIRGEERCFVCSLQIFEDMVNDGDESLYENYIRTFDHSGLDTITTGEGVIRTTTTGAGYGSIITTGTGSTPPYVTSGITITSDSGTYLIKE